MKNRLIILLTLLSGVALGFIGGVSLANRQWSASAEKQRLRIQSLERIASAERTEHIVIRALETFKRDTGSFPSGANLDAMATLRDHSPKDLLFVDRDISFDAAGNLLDPWGIAYEIRFAHDGGRVFVTSAGPDRMGWTADDIHAKSD